MVNLEVECLHTEFMDLTVLQFCNLVYGRPYGGQFE